MDSVIAQQFGEIKKGKLFIFDQDNFKYRIGETQDCRIEIIVLLRQGSVTQQMRKYYFGPLMREMQKAFFAAGHEYSIDEIDHTFRMKALYKEVFDKESGRYIKEPHSLKEADTEVTISMFMYYIEFIIRFAIENLDWAVGFPNELLTTEDLTDTMAQTMMKSTLRR